MSTTQPVADSSRSTDSKTPETVPQIHDLLRDRWSPRSFSDRDVSDQDLKTIFEAAGWAASSYNEQPWRFIVAKKSDPEAFQKLLGLLVPMNQEWAKSAPVLFITVGKKTFSGNGSPNRYALHDAGQALANLSLQATALGMHTHAMGGYDVERARKELGVPDDFEMGAAVALGYRDSPDKLPEKMRDKETAKRERKPLDQVVFGEGWGKPLPL